MVYFKIIRIISLIFFLTSTEAICSESDASAWIQENEYLKLSSGCKLDHRILTLNDIKFSNVQEKQTPGMERKTHETLYYDIFYKTEGTGLPQKVELCLYGENKKIEDNTFKKLADFISYIDTETLKIYYLKRDQFKYVIFESRAMGASGQMTNYHSYLVFDLSSGEIFGDEVFSTIYYNPFYFSINTDGILKAILLHFKSSAEGNKIYYAIEEEFSNKLKH